VVKPLKALVHMMANRLDAIIGVEINSEQRFPWRSLELHGLAQLLPTALIAMNICCTAAV